jgi:hypothetical protein
MEFGLKYTIKIVINEFSTAMIGWRRISGRTSYFSVGLSAAPARIVNLKTVVLCD